MEHAFAVEHAHVMEHLELPKSVKGRKCRVPQSVLTPTRMDVRLDNGEGSPKQNGEWTNVNVYMADEKEKLGREVGQEVGIADETTSSSEEVLQVLMAGELERIQTPYFTARSSPIGAKLVRVPTPYVTARSTPIDTTPTRVPTPFPFATGQYLKSQGPANSSPGGEPKYNTSPARLQRISSSSPFPLDLFLAPPRPSSVQEGKVKGKVPAFPSPDEIDCRRPISICSTAAASFHPGIRSPLPARYSPLHNKAPKERRLPNIDSVISPDPAPILENGNPFALRYTDFFNSPVHHRSPLDKEGLGDVSPMSSERFYKLPEYAGSSDTTITRPSQRHPSQVEVSPLASPGSECRSARSPVSDAVTGEFELEEVVYFQEWKEAMERRDRFERSLVGKIRGLFKKMKRRGVDCADEETEVERRRGFLLGRLKSRVAKIGMARGRLFGRAREI